MEDGGVAYKGWAAREGRGSGTCRRVARRLVAVFSTRYLVTPLLLLFIFKYQKFKCGRHHFVFSSGCVTSKK